MPHNSPYVEFYRVLMLQIRRSVIRGGLVVNAKPVFILTILDLIESGAILSNQFYYNEELKNSYDVAWAKYLPGQSITPVYKPYYYLSNDDFWHIRWKLMPGSFVPPPDKKEPASAEADTDSKTD